MRISGKILVPLLILLTIIPLETIATPYFNPVVNPNTGTEKEKLVGSLPDAKIKLYANEEDGKLTNFKLTIDKSVLSFPDWINVSNETYYPELYYSDINQDNKQELIIVLTTDYGSEVVLQKVHVFNKVKTDTKEKFVEKSVEDPMSIIKKNVKTKLTLSEAIIKVGDDPTKINIKKYGIEPTHLFSDIALGSVIKYKIVNNKLQALVGASISPSGGYIGDLYITYNFKDNMYQAEQIKFVPTSS
jgi:hypothetical protein